MKSSKSKIEHIKKELSNISKKEINIMEVCGTHTMALAKHAIRSLIPDSINIISGPGCPVCVTSAEEINLALQLAKREDVIIATFGDMLKVPCQGDSLMNYKNVKIIYSPLDSIKLAKLNPKKNIVLLGIGFETTTPLIASTIKAAKEQNILNFSIISMHKTLPTALSVILGSPDNKIDGLLIPGHVSAVTGRKYFEFITDHKVNGVVSGFEALEIMESIYLLTQNINNNEVKLLNNYTKAVTEDGNVSAMKVMDEVFMDSNSIWRGVGEIKTSGLILRPAFADFDAVKKFNLKSDIIDDAPGCLCGAILMGKAKPPHCKFFQSVCTPSNPIGPCMVSQEGTCAAYYKYNVTL